MTGQSIGDFLAARRLASVDRERGTDRRQAPYRAPLTGCAPSIAPGMSRPAATGKSRCLVQPPASGSHENRPRAPPNERQRPHGERCRECVEPRPLRKKAPELQAAAHRRRRQMPLELALAPMPHQFRQRNAHRADFLASAAECRGIRQIAGLVDPDQRSASAPRPSAPDRPSHTRGRRLRDRPDSGSCRRRSGCSGACRGTARRAWPSGRRRE